MTERERALVSSGEAARLLKCSPGWVRYLVDTGRLAAKRGAMGIRLIERAAVEKLARERRGRHGQRAR